MKKKRDICRECQHLFTDEAGRWHCDLTVVEEVAAMFLHDGEIDTDEVPKGCDRFFEHVVLTQDDPPDKGTIPWQGDP
jgi:hypothetical protein